ncbi:MAG: hypothetical protein WCV72_02100 [Patescibacteria group bacterium]
MSKDISLHDKEAATADYEILATQVRFLIELIKNWKVERNESRDAIVGIMETSLSEKRKAYIPRELVEQFIDERVAALEKINSDNIDNDIRQTMRRIFSESNRRLPYKKPRGEIDSNLLAALRDNLPRDLLKKYKKLLA